jgi:HAD superfamily hydrolase (TIGR01484 family)
MYFLALVTDYDGTIAHDSGVSPETIASLRRCKETGRKLILVTGRELPDLKSVFPEINLFDRVVAENGALLYVPAEHKETLIAPPAHEKLAARLRDANLSHLSVGRSIIATCRPHETAVLDAIRDLGLELQIIFNKEAVMALPSNVNKASGLAAALDDLGLSSLNAISFGDAENDHAFLTMSGCAVAVDNALPSLKDEADIIATKSDGAGVAEIIASLLEDECGNILRKAKRLSVVIARDEDQSPALELSPASGCVLITGGSGGGKSTLATSIIESLTQKHFQVCVLDPEGDYEDLENAVVVGDAKVPVRIAEIVELCRKPGLNPIVNMLGVDIAERPDFFRQLFGAVMEVRAQSGRPHFLLIDEAHHMLPAAHGGSEQAVPRTSTLMVTVHPDAVSAAALKLVETVLAVGPRAKEEIERFCKALEEKCPVLPADAPKTGEALLWKRKAGDRVRIVIVPPSKLVHQRHTRKYAEGNLGDRSFYFRGPDGSLNLRAQNFMIFLQIADGVDDKTWTHHLRAGDYSKWIRETVKDSALADEISGIEKNQALSPAQSRTSVKDSLTRRYTASAQATV